MIKTTKVFFIILVSLGLVACGQGMNTKTSNSSGKLGGGIDSGNDGGGTGTVLAPVPFDVQKVTEEIEADSADAVAEANAAAAEAEAYLNRINLGGGRIEVTGAEGSSQQLIVDKAIKKVLDKILEKLAKSPEVFDKLRAKLAGKISELDSTNPLHQAAIAALMTAMGKIDDLESRFGDLMDKVADAIDLVTGRLEVLVAAVPFPANLLVAIEWADVKRVLQEFQNSLRNL